MQSEELKPCPFCGGPASIEQYGDRSQSTIYNCDNCSCSLETGEEFNHGAQWNCRAEAALSAAEPQPAPSVAVKALQAIVERSYNGELGTSKVIDMRNIALSALSAQVQDVAVAEIVSAHGDPEAFGERELVALIDIQKFPYRTKLYAAAPAKQEGGTNE